MAGFFIFKMIDLKLKEYKNVYLVGGAVRDYLLGREIEDLDFVCKCEEKDFRDFAKNFFEKNFKIKPFLFGKKSPQTYRGVYKGKFIDLTILQKNFKFDAERRDFTINSIYYDFEKNKFIDPLNGIGDLRNKIIKVSSSNSFTDDPLRILRTFRFYGILNGFKIEKKTLTLAKENSHLIKNVASERIKEELDRIILSKKRYVIFKILNNFSIINKIFKNFKVENLTLLKRISENLDENEKKIFTYTLLFPEDLKRIKPSNRELSCVKKIYNNYKKVLTINDENEIMEFIFKNGDYINLIFKFCDTFYNIKNRDKFIKLLKKYNSQRDKIYSFINGNDILSLGIREGKKIGEILNKVRFLYYKGEFKTKDEAIFYIKKNFFG